MMAAYYNEIDPYAAQWLRNLIVAGHIAPGDVDDRSIEDVQPDDLRGYGQCHFFAGIGGWSLALRLAGVPDGRPVWTGSCPCQPLSSAGQRKGHADERHLWPAFYRLVAEFRPAVVIGEQVASPLGREWLAAVRADLEGAGYAVGAADLCAASLGAPHIRQRLFWVAHAERDGWEKRRRDARCGAQTDRSRRSADNDGHAGPSVGLADADGGQPGQARPLQPGGEHGQQPENGGTGVGLADTHGAGREQGQRHDPPALLGALSAADSIPGGLGASDGFWRDVDWLLCWDGKWRPVEPGTQPLAHGVSDILENVLSFCKVAEERIADYAERRQADTDEVLRMVWSAIHQIEGREKQSTGMRGKLHAAQVLLDFMLSQAAACDRAANGGSLKKEGKAAVAGAVQLMRMDGGFVQSSHRQQPDEQQTIEPANSVHQLSLLLACDAQAFGEAVLDAHASLDRVHRLRAYGNAIVPQVAAAFVAAAMECRP